MKSHAERVSELRTRAAPMLANPMLKMSGAGDLIGELLEVIGDHAKQIDQLKQLARHIEVPL